MQLQESGEMYLETIYVLAQRGKPVRSVDVGEHMGFSKPSVSRAVGLLREGGYVVMNAEGHLSLTESGQQAAEKIFRRHTVLTQLLVSLGIDEKTASEDACRMEHVISDTTYQAIQRYILRDPS